MRGGHREKGGTHAGGPGTSRESPSRVASMRRGCPCGAIGIRGVPMRDGLCESRGGVPRRCGARGQEGVASMRVKCHLCGVILCVRAHPRGEAQARGERSSVMGVTQVGPEGPRKERYLSAG